MGSYERRTPFPESSVFGGIPEKADLGQILLRQGVIRSDQLEECLKLQRELATQVQTPPPRLGELLVQKGYATREAIVRALREQSKKILYCMRCGIIMNVDARPDAIDYKCGRCQGTLVEPPPGLQDRCSDTQVIVNSRLPVPPEVMVARQDPARRFGKYVILEPLGRGGIAEVHRAWDTYLHQYVALKRIRTGVSEGMDTRQSRIASLLNEAHNAIRLRHPNIVTVYDIGRVGNSFYISMEYLDGRTLYEAIRIVREAGRVSPYYDDPRRWTGVVFQAAHAVHYAHTRPIPIFHCDLKPGNIFVTKEDRVCVLDFGLAHQVGELSDESGAIAGTPSYMAPEQVQGYAEGLDARTDVYGLGTVLYELLAGQPPFTGEMADVLGKVLDEPPPPPGRIAQDGRVSRLSPEVELFCLRCLEKDPAKRPPSAGAFAQELEKLVGGSLAIPQDYDPPSSQLPVVKGAPPLPSRGKKPGLWTPGLIVASSLAIGVAILWGTLGKSWTGDFAGQASARLADFQPEGAWSLDPGLRTNPEFADFRRRLEAAEVFKVRLIEAVSTRKPELKELPVGGLILKDVKVRRAKPQNIVFQVGDEPDEAPWSKLGPAGIAALARACGLLDRPADRYGLAVYCAAAGARGEAREILESLRGTEYESAAKSCLDGLKGR
jgi:serine/threonine protein kinase